MVAADLEDRPTPDQIEVESTSDEPRPPMVAGVTESDWKRWQMHPASKLMRHYLKASVKKAQGQLTDAVMEGPVSEAVQAQVRAEIMTMISLASLTFDEILGFYAEYQEFRPTKDEEETL